MSKRERQAYRQGILHTLGTIAVLGSFMAIAIGFLSY